MAQRCTPAVERLENRTLLSAKTVVVPATKYQDFITIKQSGGSGGAYLFHIKTLKSTKSGAKPLITSFSVPKKKVAGISIGAGAGADHVTLKFGTFTPKFLVTIDGGTGDDQITGSSERDYILGGKGNDSINGGGGDDQIYGDTGNDTLLGGDGDDTLGGDDEDQLIFLNAPFPTDVAGNDLLNGGDGDDWLLGGPQNAQINGSDGQDTFIGGSGNDILDARDADDVVQDKEAGDFVPRTDGSQAATPAATDAHATLKIQVKNTSGKYVSVYVPQGIGFFSGHTATLTTQDVSGTIHFQSATANDTYHLKDFFQIWGLTFSKTHIGRFTTSKGRVITMKVNGVANSQFQNYTPHDQDQILIRLG